MFDTYWDHDSGSGQDRIGLQLQSEVLSNTLGNEDYPILDELRELVRNAIDTGMSLNHEIIEGQDLVSLLRHGGTARVDLDEGLNEMPSHTSTSALVLDNNQLDTRLDLLDIRLGVLELGRTGDGAGASSSSEPFAGQNSSFTCIRNTMLILRFQGYWPEL